MEMYESLGKFKEEIPKWLREYNDRNTKSMHIQKIENYYEEDTYNKIS